MDDPNVLKIKHGGGACLFFFGLPFFAAGIFAMVSPFIPDLKWEDGHPPPLYFILPFGAVFAAVGGAIMFGRAGVDIDARRRTVSTWWGFLFPMGGKTTQLSRDAFVSITKIRKRSDKSSYWSYDVKLEGDFETIDVEENRDWFKSRQRAEEIAKLLGSPMVDRSQGEENVVQAEDLDKSLNEKLTASGEELDLPSPPRNLTTQVEMRGEGIRFKIPAPGFSLLHVFQLAGLGFIYLIMWFLFFRHFLGNLWDEPFNEVWPFFAFSTIFFLVPGIGVFSSILRDFTQSSEVEADPTRLKIVTRKYFIGKTFNARMSEIEDLSKTLGEDGSNLSSKLPYNRFIRVVSDKGQVAFGHGLPPKELIWIYDVLRYLISKGN